MPVPHTHRPPSFLLNSNQKRDRISQPGIFPLVCIVPTIYIPSLPLSTPISLLTTSLSPPTVHPCVSRLSPSPPSPPMSAFFLPSPPHPFARSLFHGVARGTGIVSRYPRIPRPLATRNKEPTMGPRRDLQPYLPPLCYSFPLSFSFFLSFFPPSSSLSVSLLASTY